MVNWSNVSHNLAVGEDEDGTRWDPRPKNRMVGFSVPGGGIRGKACAGSDVRIQRVPRTSSRAGGPT